MQFPEMKHTLNNLKTTHPSLFTCCHDCDDRRRANLQKKEVNINIDLVLLFNFFLSSPSQYFYDFFKRIPHLPKDKMKTVFIQPSLAGEIIHVKELHMIILFFFFKLMLEWPLSLTTISNFLLHLAKFWVYGYTNSLSFEKLCFIWTT